MTTSKAATRPTDAEIAILSVLWKRGPSTVRDVHAALESRNTGYTTVLKLMQIMFAKRLVARDESERSHVYRPLADAARTRGRLVADFIDQVFAGSAAALVMNALSSKPSSRDELDAIRALLDAKERERSTASAGRGTRSRGRAKETR
jgi:BlaI family penicillinase repressor